MAKISARGACEIAKFYTDRQFSDDVDYSLRQLWVVRSDGKVLNRIVGRVRDGVVFDRISTGYKLAQIQFKADQFDPASAESKVRDYLIRRGYIIVGVQRLSQ